MMKLFHLLLVVGCAVALENGYTPSSEVKRFEFQQFELSEEYAKDVGYRCIPIVAVGIFLFLVLIFWSCGRTCCESCCRRSEKEGCKNCYTILIALLLITCAGMVIYGFAINRKQGKAFDDISAALDELVGFVNDTQASIAAVTEAAVELNASVSELELLDPSHTYFSEEDADTVYSAMDDLLVEADQLNQEITDFDIKSLQDDFENDIDEVNKWRNLAVIVSLSLICFLIIVRGIMALMDGHCDEGLRPKDNGCCKCLHMSITPAFVLVLLIVWIVAAVMFAATTFFADFCIDPSTNIINITNTDNEYTEYYLFCNQNPSLVNPTNAEIDRIEVDFDTANATIQNATASINCTGVVDPTCQQVLDQLDNVEGNLTHLLDTIGTDTDGDGNGDSGLLYQVSCDNLSQIYDNFLTIICVNFFDPLSALFIAFLVFGSIMALVEVLQKIVPHSDLPRTSESSGRIIPHNKDGKDLGFDAFSEEASATYTRSNPPPHEQAFFDSYGVPSNPSEEMALEKKRGGTTETSAPPPPYELSPRYTKSNISVNPNWDIEKNSVSESNLPTHRF